MEKQPEPAQPEPEPEYNSNDELDDELDSTSDSSSDEPGPEVEKQPEPAQPEPEPESPIVGSCADCGKELTQADVRRVGSFTGKKWCGDCYVSSDLDDELDSESTESDD
eukprot:SAG22_NODE_7427_length_741_cov_0.755452_1_plen_109_part_00